MAKRILITGAGGFVGRRLAHALSGEILAGGALLCWTRKSLPHPCEAVDVRSRDDVERSVRAFSPTHVVHLAAQSHVPTSFHDPFGTWEVNAMGTLYVLEAVKRFVPDAGVLVVGSSEVYGGAFRRISPVGEDAPLEPLNPYAASKAAADLMANQYAASGLRVVRCRPFNHIGAGQGEGFVASTFAAQIARIEVGMQEAVLLVGNLDAKRDFLHVSDVVQAYLCILERIQDLPAGVVMNLCSGTVYSIRDILEKLLSMSKVNIILKNDASRMRPSDTPVAIGTAETAHRLLGWQPRMTLDQSLQDLLDDWRIAVRAISQVVEDL